MNSIGAFLHFTNTSVFAKWRCLLRFRFLLRLQDHGKTFKACPFAAMLLTPVPQEPLT
jgi:hypothetical protein